MYIGERLRRDPALSDGALTRAVKAARE